MYLCLHEHTYTHTFIDIHSHTRARAHTHTHTYTYTCTYNYTYTYTHTHTGIHTYTYTCTYIHTYTYTHTLTDIHSQTYTRAHEHSGTNALTQSRTQLHPHKLLSTHSFALRVRICNCFLSRPAPATTQPSKIDLLLAAFEILQTQTEGKEGGNFPSLQTEEDSSVASFEEVQIQTEDLLLPPSPPPPSPNQRSLATERRRAHQGEWDDKN